MKTPLAILATYGLAAVFAIAAPLPSWNEGPNKRAITKLVEAVATDGGPAYLPPAERIAVFDNDGTLWSEQPLYFQLIYVLDTIKAKAAEHPEWKTKEPFASVLKGDLKAVLASGHEGVAKLLAATHAGMTTDEFAKSVREWIATARHPKTGKLYTEMTFRPMVELLEYLRENGFKTYIVSGGGAEFMRQWAEAAYGIPPEQVIGSLGKMRYEVRDGRPVMLKEAELFFNDDKEGKPEAIQSFIGRRPIAAFGNSDGDYQMLEWTTKGQKGPRLGVLIHHDDAAREWAYDRDSSIGKLSKGLDDAKANGWAVVSMKEDWKTIYATPAP